MKRTDVVVIGAGQAGLAASRCLSDEGIDHVVLERGQVGERWRSERWNSLRLLTPNWQTRLPGYAYRGEDPHGFMSRDDVVQFLSEYAAVSKAPVREDTRVVSVKQHTDGLRVVTTGDVWRAQAVVVATGYCDRSTRPSAAARLSGDITNVFPSAYKAPDQLPEGGVLVVGASATGLQLADELHQAGRRVVLAVGHHTRVPRHYRGRDIFGWLDAMGVMRDGPEQVYDVGVSRDQPSFQLVGRPDHRTLTLKALQESGVTVTGRLRSADGTRVHLSDDLVATTAAADAKLALLLRRVDRFADQQGTPAASDAEAFDPLWKNFVEAPSTLDLKDQGIRSVLWATGFQRSYPWLHLPVLTPKGEIAHAQGVTAVRGVYVMGLHFQRRRNSSFIDGVGEDAQYVTDHISHMLRRPRVSASASLEQIA